MRWVQQLFKARNVAGVGGRELTTGLYALTFFALIGSFPFGAVDDVGRLIGRNYSTTGIGLNADTSACVVATAAAHEQPGSYNGKKDG
jgi:hypothetical protein